MPTPIPDAVKATLSELTSAQQVVLRGYIATLREEIKSFEEQVQAARDPDPHAHYHGHDKCTADHGHAGEDHGPSESHDHKNMIMGMGMGMATITTRKLVDMITVMINMLTGKTAIWNTNMDMITMRSARTRAMIIMNTLMNTNAITRRRDTTTSTSITNTMNITTNHEHHAEHDDAHKHDHGHNDDDIPAWKKKAIESGATDPMAAPFGGDWTTEASVSAKEDKMQE